MTINPNVEAEEQDDEIRLLDNQFNNETEETRQAKMFVLDPGATLNELVEAVNNIGAAPSDILAILETLKQAGALFGDLEGDLMKVPELTYPKDQVSSIYDLKELDRLRSRTQDNDQAALRQVAQKFEAIFVGMLLKSMRDANQYFEQDNHLQSNNTKFYRDMHDQQMAQDLGKHGAFGLADLIVQQLAPTWQI